MVHGHFFEDLGFLSFATYYASGSSSSVTPVFVFDDGDFSFDVDRRKVCVASQRNSMLSAVVVGAEKCPHRQDFCAKTTTRAVISDKLV